MATSKITLKIKQHVLKFFNESSDCNGIIAEDLRQSLDLDEELFRTLLRNLVEKESVSLSFATDYNPHIKATADHPIAKQVELLSQSDLKAVNVYPSVEDLKKTIDDSKFVGKPFERLLRVGHTQLEPIAFEMQVLDRYRNDPRFSVKDDGTLIQIITQSAMVDLGEDISEPDEIALKYIGHGQSQDGRHLIIALPRYLAKLRPSHQQYWQSFLFKEAFAIDSEFAKRCFTFDVNHIWSVYDLFLQEQVEINKICKHFQIPELFMKTFPFERPIGFSPMTQSTSTKFATFVHLLDKLISDNLNKEFFRHMIELEETRKLKGRRIQVVQKGTLRLLEEYMKEYFRRSSPDLQAAVMKTFRKIRKLRQQPAHTVHDNYLDDELELKQEELIIEAHWAVMVLRRIFLTVPLAFNYRVADGLDATQIKLR